MHATIAFCDILGFSAMVEENPLEAVVGKGLGRLRKVLHHSLHHEDFPGKVPAFKELQNHAELGLFWFSDSILMFTRQDTDEAVRRLLETLAWLHFETILADGLRLRSAVSYGEVYIDEENAVFVGKPIIDAYHLEKKQAWTGGALEKSAVDRLPQSVRCGTFAEWGIVPYKVPVTDDRKYVDTLAVNWTQGIHRPDCVLRWSKESSSPSPRDIHERSEIARKFLNTKRFHDAVCRHCTPEANQRTQRTAGR